MTHWRQYAVLAFAICLVTGCLIPATPATPDGPSTAGPPSAEATSPPLEMGEPPGPVLTLALLPDGEFLAGVGPIGAAETGFEWRLYRGRDKDWRPLTWPPEAIPRSLYSVPSGDLVFAVPFSNALFGRGQAWGLMRSADGGRTWQQALTGLGDPYVMDLALSPAPAGAPEAQPGGTNPALFVVTWYSGVYRSVDTGQTWEPMPLAGAEAQPSGGANPYDVAVAVSPDYGSSAGQGLVLASFSHGLHRWDPAANAWQTAPLTVSATLDDFDPPEAQLAAGKIAFSPNFAEDGTVYLYSGYAGLFRSGDRGETWQPISRRLPLPPPFVTDFHLAVASRDEAYVLLDSDESDPSLGRPIRILYRTLDGGRWWEALTDPPTLGWVSSFAMSRDAEGRVVLHLGGSQGGVSSHLADALPWD